MAKWLERLGGWLEGPPPEPTSEVKSRIREIISQRKAAQKDLERQRQAEEAKEQARNLEIRQRSLAILRESNISRLLNDAKRALQPLYPTAIIHEQQGPILQLTLA